MNLEVHLEPVRKVIQPAEQPPIRGACDDKRVHFIHLSFYRRRFHIYVSHELEKGFGKAPVFTREGGSIPVVATFQEELGIPSVLFGVGLPDENAHAPNEKLDLSNFHNGVIASAHLYDEIARA